MRERRLLWDGCVNVRDLGGMPLEGGGETRFGVVVRADSIRRLSDSGWRELVGYGIATVLDLRYQAELDADPPRELDTPVVHVPILPEPGTDFWYRIDAMSAAEPDPVVRTRDTYLEFLERRRAQFAAALETIAQADSGAILVHCMGGKDRTGLVCALLLRVAGVPVEAIADDYGESERNLAEATARWVAAAATDAERDWRLRVSAGPSEAMLEVLEALEKRHGGAAGYLRAAGLDDESIARLRERLRA